jgi:hypothetical protein
MSSLRNDNWLGDIEMRLREMKHHHSPLLMMIVGALLLAEPHALAQTNALAQKNEVMHDAFHFTWSREPAIKIDSVLDRVSRASNVSTSKESRVVLENAVVRCRYLTVFFVQDEAADGVKVVEPSSIAHRLFQGLRQGERASSLNTLIKLQLANCSLSIFKEAWQT